MENGRYLLADFQTVKPFFKWKSDIGNDKHFPNTCYPRIYNPDLGFESQIPVDFFLIGVVFPKN